MGVGKQKSRRSVAKRIRITGTGKIVMQKSGHKHRLVAKSKRAKGLAKKTHLVFGGDALQLKKAVPIMK